MKKQAISIIFLMFPLVIGMTECEPLEVEITEPAHGAFVTGTSLLVRGTSNADPTTHSVTVNGTAAAVDVDGNWSVDLPLETPVTSPFARLEVLASANDGTETVVTDVTVIRGPSQPASDPAHDALVVHLPNRGLDLLEDSNGLIGRVNAALSTEFDANPDTPAFDSGEVIHEDSCAKSYCIPVPFDSCAIELCHSVEMSLKIPPRAQTAQLFLTAGYQTLQLTLRLTGFRMDADAAISSSPDCDVIISAGTVDVRVALDVQVDPDDAKKLRVRQVSQVVSTINAPSGSASCGTSPWLSGHVEGIVEGQLDAQIEQKLSGKFAAAFGRRDDEGHTIVSRAVQEKLDDISLDELVEPLHETLGAEIDATFANVLDGYLGTGVTVLTDVALTTTCERPDNAPVLDTVFAPIAAVGEFPVTVPVNAGGDDDDGGYTGPTYPSNPGGGVAIDETITGGTGSTSGTWTATTSSPTWTATGFANEDLTITGGTYTSFTEATTGTVYEPSTGSSFDPGVSIDPSDFPTEVLPVPYTSYHAALAISPTAVNQVLRVQTECGRLHRTITELDGEPLTTGIIAEKLTQGPISLYTPADPTTPARIDVVPTLAPFVTRKTGQGGALAELRVGAVNVVVVDEGPEAGEADDEVILSGELELTAGVDIDYNARDGKLSVDVRTPDPSAIVIHIEDAPSEFVAAILELLGPAELAGFIPAIADAIEEVSVPSINLRGIDLTPTIVNISRHDGYFAFYVELPPIPSAYCIENPHHCTDGEVDPCKVFPDACDDGGELDPCEIAPDLCGDPCKVAWDPELCGGGGPGGGGVDPYL